MVVPRPIVVDGHDGMVFLYDHLGDATLIDSIAILLVPLDFKGKHVVIEKSLTLDVTIGMTLEFLNSDIFRKEKEMAGFHGLSPMV